MDTDDPYDLGRFVVAQNDGGTYDDVLRELRGGHKSSHWMWFVFPQIAGLGRSPMSIKFAISTLEEAKAYLCHPVLGPRIIECAEVLLNTHGRTAVQIFGGIDAQKLRSSMTLFRRADPEQPVFGQVIDMYFEGSTDEATDQRI